MYVLLTGPNQEDKYERGMLQVWGEGGRIGYRILVGLWEKGTTWKTQV